MTQESIVVISSVVCTMFLWLGPTAYNGLLPICLMFKEFKTELIISFTGIRDLDKFSSFLARIHDYLSLFRIALFLARHDSARPFGLFFICYSQGALSVSCFLVFLLSFSFLFLYYFGFRPFCLAV